jgi:hypothetical protein
MTFQTVLLILASAASAFAQNQLNENCTVAVLNRTAQVRADGTWVIPNIPANFGLVRARATCVQNGTTRSGESALFSLAPNQSLNIPSIQLGATTLIPTSLVIRSVESELTPQSRSTQLTVTAGYANGTSRNVSAAALGTTYTISNPAIATISPDGLVTAVSSGLVLIQASNEGAQALFTIAVVLTGDTDGDEIPDDVELREGLNPRDPSDATADFDNDGLNNRRELIQTGTQIRNRDTDGDGLSDGEEVNGLNGFTSNPLVIDTDGDGVNDFLEVTVARTNPRDAASVNFQSVITRIDVTPASFTLTVNTLNPSAFTQLSVIGTLVGGGTINLTARSRGTDYSSSDLTVCNFGAQDGRVFAGQTGACTITINAAGRTVTAAGSVQTFQPTRLSQIAIPGYANNVDVSGAYAYVAAGSTGLQVVNVSNPSSPSIVSSRDTAGNANDVRVVGGFAYIADGTNGLVIVNVANPLAPSIVGTVDTPGEAVDVFVAGNFAYIADSASGLSIANITNPTAPILVSTTATGGIALGVAVRQNLAVVVSDNTNTLRTFDITNPSSPVAQGSLTLAGSLKDVSINGDIAAVAAFTGGTHFVDLTNPASPIRRGGLSGQAPSGFVPRDVEFGGSFAVYAEQLFPNAVPFVDYSDLANPALRGVIDFAPIGDYAGTGIALAGPFVYMTGENFIVGPENGSSGNTRLFIGQYLPLVDLAGVPPTVSVTVAPMSNPFIQGERLTLNVDATDDVAVVSVNFLVDGVVVFTDTSAPYQYAYTIPSTVSRSVVTAEAVDLGGNRGRSTALELNSIPDPLTTVTGRVLDENGNAIVGAQISVTGDVSGVSTANGNFSIAGVSTILGGIVASATTEVSGVELRGSSLPVPPVRGGTTSVGELRLVSARWETQIGPCWTTADDTFTSVNLPFAFPFFGVNQTTAFVGTNGYITFGTGDSNFVETIPSFNNLPRVAAFFDDLYGRSTGCAHFNALADRLVVTYNTVQHFSVGGSNTLQIILFRDGRIQFGYRGITALTTGSITGITPGPNSPAQQVDYSATPSLEGAPGSAIFEYFLGTSPFDLDGAFIIFTPRPGGGYSVRTILPSGAPPSILVTGGAGGSAPQLAAESQLDGAATDTLRITLQPEDAAAFSQPNAVDAQQISNAEVEVKTSSDRRYTGNTNTDRRGTFSIPNVPRGGINITVTKDGRVLGRGSAVLPPFPTTQRAVTIVVVEPTAPAKP